MIQYQDYILDSNEELHFCYFLNELKEHGYIKEWYKNYDSMEIIPKQTGMIFSTKNIQKSFFITHSLSYTYDFKIVWNNKAEDIFYFRNNSKISKKKSDIIFYIYTSNKDEVVSFIDVKGTFGYGNSAITFPIIQKILLHFYKIYIQKIVPIDLFRKTFLPEILRYKKNGELRIEAKRTITLKEFINKNKNKK